MTHRPLRPGQPVKAEQRALTGVNDAPTHHRPPGKQVASKPGGDLPDPPSTVPDQRERGNLRSFSKGFAVPIENDYICGTVVLLRLEDGRLKAQRVDCRTKACPKCGPRLRAEWAALWSQAMAGERVYRWEGSDKDCAKLLRRKVMRGHEYGVVPSGVGERMVFTTADVTGVDIGQGKPVEDLEEWLVEVFSAMPNDSRQRSLSAGWQKRADCVQAFSAAPAGKPQQRVEFVGILRQGLEHARQLAREFGVYEEEAGIDGSAFIFRQPDDPQAWRRFKRWTGLDEPSRRRRHRLKAVAA